MRKPDPTKILGAARGVTRVALGGVVCGVCGVLGGVTGSVVADAVYGLDDLLGTHGDPFGSLVVRNTITMGGASGVLGVVVGVALGIRGRLDLGGKAPTSAARFLVRSGLIVAGYVVRWAATCSVGGGAFGSFITAIGFCTGWAGSCYSPRPGPMPSVDGMAGGILGVLMGLMLGVYLGTVVGVVAGIGSRYRKQCSADIAQ